MLATGNVPITYKELPGGFRGTDETVRLMTQVSMGKFGARSPKIRALARNILAAAKVPEKDYTAEALALARWVRLNIRYMKDPYGQETISHPEEVAFNMKAGDCDDQAALVAALLGSVGVPSRFKVMGITPLQYSHVYLQAKPADHWINLDPIMTNKPEGWEVPKSQRAIEKTYPVNTPDGWSDMQGVGMALGYVADPRVVSFLDEPVIPRMAGTGQQPSGRPAPAQYVMMPSGLDTDQGVDHMMAFPPNQNAPRHQGNPRAQRIDPQLRRIGYPGSMDDDGADHYPVMDGHQVIGPDSLASMDVIGEINRQAVPAQLQTSALRQVPEGVDLQFARAGMVADTSRGDVIQWRGTPSKQQKPPIRAYTAVAGLGGGRTLPGMGMFRGMAGPGMGEEATGNEPWPSDIPPQDLIGPEEQIPASQMPPAQMPPAQTPPAQMPVDNILTRQTIAGIPNWALLASAVGVLVILRKRK